MRINGVEMSEALSLCEAVAKTTKLAKSAPVAPEPEEPRAAGGLSVV